MEPETKPVGMMMCIFYQFVLWAMLTGLLWAMVEVECSYTDARNLTWGGYMFLTAMFCYGLPTLLGILDAR